MILFAGIPSEPPLALAITSAEKAGVPHVVLNQRAFMHDHLDIRLTDGFCRGSITVGMQNYPVDMFTGIYTRATDPHALPELQPHGRRPASAFEIARSIAWSEAFNAWLEIAPQRIVNRTSDTLSNFSKPYQLQKIAACGFPVPETLVSNNPGEVRKFRDHHRRVIYKSTSSIRSIVKVLDDDAMTRLDRLSFLPTQFQAFIPGDDVRVHVVGNDTFAVCIKSEAVDYRYAARDGLNAEMQVHLLPQDVAARCVRLSQVLCLPFCGIDLRLTPESRYVCFEVNPAPAYSYYQEQSGVPISDALVRYLANAEGGLRNVDKKRAA
jgi:RimK-like ATP-grasp domain